MREILYLPAERHSQLIELSNTYGLSITDTIGRLIRQEIRAGVIADRVPGFVITARADQIEFGFTASGTMLLSGGAAITLAQTIETYATKRAGGTLDLDAGGFTVSRVGTGVRIELPEGQAKVVSRDVARDVAELLRRAVGTKLAA
jgi:hypothetical protein